MGSWSWLWRRCESTRSRILWMMVVIAIIMGAIAIRLSLVSLRPPAAPHLSQARAVRANLADRHGNILASSLLTYSIYAHPAQITHLGEAIAHLCRLFPHLNAKRLKTDLTSSKPFVWVARHITPQDKMRFESLGLEGFDVQKDYKRLYVHDRYFSHLIGTTDVDMRGTSGLEKSLDPRLNKGGNAVRLSLDVTLQYHVYDALAAQKEKIQADAANAVLIHARTGEILAMVSLPDFSPRSRLQPTDISFFNRNVSGVYEFGSIFKIHNCALFLDSKAGTLQTTFPGIPFAVGRKMIRDYQGKNRTMSVLEGFIYSSNIINAHMADTVGRERQKAFFHRLHLDRPLRIELSECARPLLPRDSSRITLATLSYGYGLAITPLHMVHSLATLVTGYATPLTLLAKAPADPQGRSPQPDQRKEVIQPNIVQSVRHLLEQAVLNGQAKKAASANVRVGAKTGTANLLDARGRRREKENLTTCVAAFPINDPQYILFVSLENGKASRETYGHATAGWFAAPVIQQIVDAIAPTLGLLSPLATSEDVSALPSEIPTTPSAPAPRAR